VIAGGKLEKGDRLILLGAGSVRNLRIRFNPNTEAIVDARGSDDIEERLAGMTSAEEIGDSLSKTLLARRNLTERKSGTLGDDATMILPSYEDITVAVLAKD